LEKPPRGARLAPAKRRGEKLPRQFDDRKQRGETEMTRRFSVLLLGVVAALFLALPALAQTAVIEYTGIALGAGNYYAGPRGGEAGVYYASVTIGTTTTNNVLVVCDDFLNDIGAGQSWSAYINTNQGLSTNPNGNPLALSTGVRYSPTGTPAGYYDITNPTLTAVTPQLTQQEEYNMISSLVTQIFASSDGNQINAMEGAIWAIADCGWSGDGSCLASGGYASQYGNPSTTGSAAWYVNQALGQKDITQTTYTLYTPFASAGCGTGSNPSCNGQEFWTKYSPTPEPAASLLLAVGALALALGSLVSKKFLA